MTLSATSRVMKLGSRIPNPPEIKHQMDLGVSGRAAIISLEKVCVWLCGSGCVGMRGRERNVST